MPHLSAPLHVVDSMVPIPQSLMDLVFRYSAKTLSRIHLFGSGLYGTGGVATSGSVGALAPALAPGPAG